MLNLKKCALLILFSALAACVTINVYFPAAAAESAADRIIKEVYGEKAPGTAPPVTEPQTYVAPEQTNILLGILQTIIPAAYAQQPDLDISSPGINKLRAAMTQRHKELSPYYDSGAIAMDNNGLLTERDIKAVPLKERNMVKKLIADENRDRNSLYSEIARANGHPEWEDDIRKTFARRWVANAPRGWWYQGAKGNWEQK